MKRFLERLANLLDFALSSLWRRKGKNLSLLAVYGLIVFTLASVLFLTQAIKREAVALLTDAPDLVVQRMVAGRHDPIPNAYADAISRIRGVSAVSPRLWGYYFDAVTGANYTILGGVSEPAAEDGVCLGSGVARTCRVAVGDFLPLKGADGTPALFSVEKILPVASELVAADLIQMREAAFRKFFAFPQGHATDLAVTVPNPGETATVAAKIAADFPDTRPILKSEMLRTYDSVFDWRGGMMVVLFGGALLSFAIFAWDKATGISAEERREIGILKSIGWETGDVLLFKTLEGTAISLTAFLLGTALAYLHVFFFSARLFAQAFKGWSVLYPQFTLTPALDPYQLLVLFFLTVGPYLAATVVPCWHAATVDPDAALRS